jgi:hypothetical protein
VRKVLVDGMREGRTHPFGIAGGLHGKALKCWYDGWRSQGISRLSVQLHVMPGVAFPPVGRLGFPMPFPHGLCNLLDIHLSKDVEDVGQLRK